MTLLHRRVGSKIVSTCLHIVFHDLSGNHAKIIIIIWNTGSNETPFKYVFNYFPPQFKTALPKLFCNIYTAVGTSFARESFQAS